MINVKFLFKPDFFILFQKTSVEKSKSKSNEKRWLIFKFFIKTLKNVSKPRILS